MANLIDKAIEYMAPGAALKRAHARRVLAYYEAAKADRMRKNRRETGSGNDAILRAGASLRRMLVTSWWRTWVIWRGESESGQMASRKSA